MDGGTDEIEQVLSWECALRNLFIPPHILSWIFQVFLIWSSAQPVLNSHGRAVLQGPEQRDVMEVYQKDREAAVAHEQGMSQQDHNVSKHLCGMCKQEHSLQVS